MNEVYVVLGESRYISKIFSNYSDANLYINHNNKLATSELSIVRHEVSSSAEVELMIDVYMFMYMDCKRFNTKNIERDVHFEINDKQSYGLKDSIRFINFDKEQEGFGDLTINIRVPYDKDKTELYFINKIKSVIKIISKYYRQKKSVKFINEKINDYVKDI